MRHLHAIPCHPHADRPAVDHHRAAALAQRIFAAAFEQQAKADGSNPDLTPPQRDAAVAYWNARAAQALAQAQAAEANAAARGRGLPEVA